MDIGGSSNLILATPYVSGPMAFIEKAGNLDGVPPSSLLYPSELTSAGEPTGFSGYLGILGIFYRLAAWFSVACI